MFGIGERAMVTLRQYFASAVAKHPRGLDQLVAIGTLMSRIHGRSPCISSVIARCEFSSPDTSNLQPNEEACIVGVRLFRQVMQEALELGLRDGSIRPDAGDPQAVTVCLWGIHARHPPLSSAKATMLARDGLQPRQLLEQAMSMMTRSLMNPG